MLFNTYTYACFLPLVLLLYAGLALRGRQLMLLAASYVFYCWETPIYGTLLLISTCLDFSCGLIMARTERPLYRRLILTLSIAGNLSLLGFFKYVDFFGASAAGLGRLLGFETGWQPMNFILPVGISFYTFQTMSYTIQLYRRQIEPCRDLLSFALFVSFFPQLVAGPIERASNLLPQLQTFQRMKLQDLTVGATRIAFGLFRKLVIADRFSILVDRVFSAPGEYSTLTVWVGVFAFLGQIYFDFAGYADIAIGSARLFGIRLTENFRRPLLARSIADFWNRWHITLTSWLRDYLFMPLGGARKGAVRTALNGAIVLVLCGLWHGAAWHFVLWGAWHALLMTLYYVWRYTRRRLFGRKPASQSLGVTIACVAAVVFCNAIGVIFFRAADLPGVARIVLAMAGRHAGATLASEWYVWVFGAMLALWWIIEFLQEYMGLNTVMRRLPWWAKALGMSLLVVAIILFATDLTAPYIYFQF